MLYIRSSLKDTLVSSTYSRHHKTLFLLFRKRPRTLEGFTSQMLIAFFCTPAWLAQSGERWSVERKVASNPGRTNTHSLHNGEESAAFVMTSAIGQTFQSSQISLTALSLICSSGTEKNPHHCSKRVGDVVVCPTFVGCGIGQGWHLAWDL